MGDGDDVRQRLDDFKTSHHVRPDAIVDVQRTGVDGTLLVGGVAFRLADDGRPMVVTAGTTTTTAFSSKEEDSEDVVRDGDDGSTIEPPAPVTVYTDDATYSHNGAVGDPPPTHVYQTRTNDEVVTVIMDPEGVAGRPQRMAKLLVTNLLSGSTYEATTLYDDVVAVVSDSDRDDAALGKRYRYGSTRSSGSDDPHGRRRRTTTTRRRGGGGARSLGATCGKDDEYVQEIELAVAYDSTFCRAHGNDRAAADAAAAAYVALTSTTKYRSRDVGLCHRVWLSHLEGHCDDDDPYAEVVHTVSVGCGGEVGVLRAFADFWDVHRRHVRRDVAHLLTGTPLSGDACAGPTTEIHEKEPECYVGCAYQDTSCTGVDAYAVNHATFTESYDRIAVLLAHEMGHNNGAEHDDDAGYIMYPAIGLAPKGFSATSVRGFESHLGSNQCQRHPPSSDEGPSSLLEEVATFLEGLYEDLMELVFGLLNALFIV